MDIKEGDVVRVKIYNHQMVVAQIDGKNAVCVYLDSKDGNKYITVSLPLTVLEHNK